MAADVRSQSNKNPVLRETCRYRLCVSTCRQTADTTFAVTLELFLDGGRKCDSIPRCHLEASRQRKLIKTTDEAWFFQSDTKRRQKVTPTSCGFLDRPSSMALIERFTTPKSPAFRRNSEQTPNCLKTVHVTRRGL